MGRIITVDFKSDTLFAVERDDGVYVAVKPICDSLGIEWRKQQERLKRDPVLAEGITMTVMPSPGGGQETTLLRLELVNGWLFGIDESRVRDEETRQRVLAYKRECYAVLHRHFYGDPHGGPAPKPAEAAIEEPVRVRRQLVSEARSTFGAKAAAQLWFKLRLPVVPAMFEAAPQSSFGFTYTAVSHNPAPKEDAA